MLHTRTAFLSGGLCATVLLLALGQGPLNPPSGPIVPTGTSLTDLQKQIGAITNQPLPIPSFPTGGSVVIQPDGGRPAFSSPLVAWSAYRPLSGQTTLTLWFAAGHGAASLHGNLSSVVVTGSGVTLTCQPGSSTARSITCIPVGGQYQQVEQFTLYGSVIVQDASGAGDL